MKAKQDIVPVTLTGDSKAPSTTPFKPKDSPSTLVARVKFSRAELFLYEEIKEEIVHILLLELSAYENY
ncbi:hypothetical protein LHA31_12730 (plasmid) [Carnobacterium viridans]|uniref:hypothetical protein n=1 Tax=Carnobacterium viridans TaxID=174587 RepID=UPI001CFFAAC5|nr:hypothetical protein [Carnobacterium viridans]UDE96403.1 hypothetical protein LHA31_12730 [Carnobacterium viridans]